ncbi:transporter substrate-binding domain-containing protein [Limosilactobacillus pontis]|nr:transporter substrate-binding domain-containing protein [Limosilactobacillus pontis]MDM8332152.1 transporter substrate-binding domain-containing protein [Limosilactobacillus pontis]
MPWRWPLCRRSRLTFTGRLATGRRSSSRYFRRRNGQLVGDDVDLSQAVCKVLGIKAYFQSIDWSMKKTELKNGTIDCIWNGYTATPSRRKRIAFSRVYELSGQSLVVRKDSGINKMADMKGENARGPGDLDGPDRPQQVSTGAEGHHQEQEADPLPGQFRCLYGPAGGPDTGDFRGRSTPATTPLTSHTTTITS